jgi:hypothetical protein
MEAVGSPAPPLGASQSGARHHWTVARIPARRRSCGASQMHQVEAPRAALPALPADVPRDVTRRTGVRHRPAKAHRMQWGFSIFHPEDRPVLSGILDFNSSKSSTDSWCSRSQPSAVKPKRRCCMSAALMIVPVTTPEARGDVVQGRSRATMMVLRALIQCDSESVAVRVWASKKAAAIRPRGASRLCWDGRECSAMLAAAWGGQGRPVLSSDLNTRVH